MKIFFGHPNNSHICLWDEWDEKERTFSVFSTFLGYLRKEKMIVFSFGILGYAISIMIKI